MESPAKTLPYQPLQSLKVSGVEIVADGLILVVGPNSSGKTQFLKDIHAILAGEQRQPVVCSEMAVNKPSDFNSFLDDLVEKKYLKRFVDPNGNAFVLANAPRLGFGPSKADQTHVPDLMRMCNRLIPGMFTTHNNQSTPFFAAIGHCLITALFLDRRLNLANETSSFDYENSPPTNEIQALFVNTEAKRDLANEIVQVFGKGVWLDSTRANILCLRINQLPIIPPAENRLEPQYMREYRTISDEGDGLRSYVGICISLLLGLRPVCLIDEPELCLHPPQAYRMGLFIGRHATRPRHTIFASTHSSHVLRGIIESGNGVQILRLTKYGNKFRGHLIGAAELAECLKRPMVRGETILDGIFADGVVLVEADGDRAVYQATWESITARRPHRDVHFIPMGGTGGFAEVASFFHHLKIPIVVIADLDFISDLEKLGRVLAAINATQRADILSKCRDVAALLRKTPPILTEHEVSGRLKEIASRPIQWENNDDMRLRRELGILKDQISRLRRLKTDGVEGMKNLSPIYEQVKQIIDACKEVGVFLVPPGEVENWAPPEISGAPSKENKAQWADWAATEIRQKPEAWVELKCFVGEVERFEIKEAGRIAGE